MASYIDGSVFTSSYKLSYHWSKEQEILGKGTHNKDKSDTVVGYITQS